MTHVHRRQPAAATFAVLTLILNPAMPLLQAAQAPAAKPAAPAGQTPAAKPSTTPAATSAKPATTTQAGKSTAAPAAAGAKPAAAPAAPVDGGWPRAVAMPGGASMLMYQPQISSWEKQAHVVAFSAVSYRTTASEKPALGTVKLEADTKVAVSDRLVKFVNLNITEANFGSLAKDKVRQITEEIDKGLPDDERVIALDRVLANIDKSTIIPKNVEGVKADPPPIFFSKTPAVIVNLDGDPIMSPIKENDLTFAVNTNWDLFQHAPSKVYYLLNEGGWLKATDLKGPWTPAGKLPGSFSKLPADENWKDVKAALPGKTVAANAVPKVLVTMKPGELLLLSGEPKYDPVQGTSLLWVSNTDSDVFRAGKTGTIYYLVTGRWFSAPDFTGPWTFATPNLPPDFKKIPLEHPRSRVLASVPGTDEANEAILVSQIPQTARVNKKDVKAPDVAFQGGQPDFKPIEQTTVQRAVNTDKDVFLIGGKYYMCYQGVWFESATSASGPWTVASTVPQEIYKIPASSSANHVTYVTVEDNNDEWVTFAAAAGYTGMMVAWGCMVWGTGYYYPPYYGFYGGYPYYYGGFSTYGYSAWYNPRTGAYGRSAAVYGPYGGAGVGARYNPRTGTYARGAAAYGPYGARGVAQAYNPRTGTYAQTRQGSNVYGSWGSTSVQRGDDWAKTNRYTNNRTGNTTRTIQSSEGNGVVSKGDNGGRVAAGSGGNVYAGKDGNVYRKDNGTWQKYDNGGWNNTPNQPSGDRPTSSSSRTGTDRPTTGTSSVDRGTMDQLNRDSRARTEGTSRTTDYGNYRSGSGTSGTGSYRGSAGASRSGGASRGGGRRR
ncbi:MAG TPA: hypothetical protein VGI12_06235 [Vicinamibacterales bacterium]